MNPYPQRHRRTPAGNLLLQSFNLFDRTNNTRLIWLNTFTGVFSIASACSGISGRDHASGRRRKVIGVGFACDFEDGNGQFFSQCRAIQEPFGIRPGLHYLLRIFVACFGFLFYVIEVIEHQQRVRKCFGSDRSPVGIIQRVDQRMNVVTTLHSAQQFDGFFRSQQWGFGFAFRDSSQEACFDIGGFIDARGTRLVNRSNRNSSSPAGGFFSSSTSTIWFASRVWAQSPQRHAQLRAYGILLARRFSSLSLS